MARIFPTLLVALSIVGCTTLQPLADSQPATIRDSVRVGDTVDIVKADGTKLSFKVASISEAAIRGDGTPPQEVAIADVRSIGKRVMTTSDKVWTGVIAAVLVGGAVAAAGSGGGGGGSGY